MNHLTIDGHLADDPRLNYSNDGRAYANARLLHTPRRFDDQKQEWVDAGETVGVDFSVSGPAGEEFAEQARKGSKVLLSGRLSVRFYETKTGEKRMAIEAKGATAAIVPKARQNGTGQGYGGQQQRPQQQRGSDPWAGSPSGSQQGWGSAPTYDEPPF